MHARAFLLAGVFLTAAGAVAAQQQLPAVLTLDDAIQIARQNNPTYRSALNDLNVQSVAVKQAWAQFIPSLSGSLGFNGNSRTTSTGEGDFGETVETDEFTVESSSASQSVGLNMTLFDGTRMFRGLDAARAQERATEAAITAAAATLVADVSRRFYDARRTDMLIEVEQRNLEAARMRYEDNQVRFRNAAVSQVDLLDAERAVIAAEQAVRTAESNARKARLTVAQALGIDLAVDFSISPELPETFDPTTLDAEALIARAVEQNPVVRQRLANVEATRANASAARGGRWPTVNANFSYSRGTNEQGFGAFGNLNPNSSRGYGFGVSVSVPLFTRFQTSFQVAQADAQADDAQHQLRQTRLETEQQVRSALIDLERAYDNFQAQERIATLSQQQVELAEEQFRLGTLDYLQFQQVIDRNAEAQRQAVEARFQFVTALVTLEERLGAPVER